MGDKPEEIFIVENSDQPLIAPQKIMQISGTTQVNLENVQDFSNVCRTCATITDFVIPIFSGEGLQNNLAEKIKKHLPIQVSESDALPLVVCYQCASTLLAWHELVQCTLQADAALKARLERDAKDPKPTSTNITLTIEEKSPSTSICTLEDNERYLEQSDDEPLASIASKKSSILYTNFYKALLNFRNHFAKEHTDEENYPDFTDSSHSDVEENIDSFDDLSHSNMRKDRMDEQTRKELAEVQRKVNGKVFYVCKICDKSLSSTHTYVFHKRIHTGERPCVCHVCGKQFRAPNGLQRHLTETHDKIKRYTCDFCPKTFANSQNLKQHLRIHTGERPFVCPQCGKRFTQSGSLHVHLKTHSSQFPHVCAECGAKFRVRAGLVRHRLKHSGERAHRCACGDSFRHPHELRAHSAAHGAAGSAARPAARPAACGACAAAFRDKRALRHHIKRMHPPDVQQPNIEVPAAELTPATPSPSQAPQYSESRSYCLLCNTWHEATDLEKHVFHCSECNRYLHRSEFMTHVADHAMHHNKKPTKRRKIKKKKSCESNNKTETPSSRPNQEKTHERMEDEFSDHSDVEFVFGPLPQSVFEAIEDSQDSQLVPDEMQSPANDTVTDVDQATEPMTTLEVENLEETIEPLPQVLETIPQSETIPLTKTSPSKTQHILNTDKTLTQSPTTPENESNSLPSTQVTEHAETKLPSPNTTKSVQDNKKARTCSQCSKVYTASSSYFYHIKYAHSTKKESCNICNKKFISKENLSQHHAAVHKREYRFECQECKKRFRSNASLYIHKQTHYSVKTWACSLCDRTFRWRTEMNRHMKRHAAEKSYVCETCGRGFSVRYDLVRHAKTHAAGSFVCDKCGQKFAQQRYLKVHMENKHS